jgi:hypothetical protein
LPSTRWFHFAEPLGRSCHPRDEEKGNGRERTPPEGGAPSNHQVRPHTDRGDSAGETDRTARLVYLAESGFRAVTAPLDEMHTAPLALPGTLMPSPVSAVTLAVNLSAEGLLEPPFT